MLRITSHLARRLSSPPALQPCTSLLTARHKSNGMTADHNHEHGTLVRLLRNIHSPKEVEYYLKHFSSLDRSNFAIIQVDGRCLEEELDTISSNVAFLQNLGLFPVLVHGAKPQLDKAMADHGLEPEFRVAENRRFRVTDQKTLRIAKTVFRDTKTRLVQSLTSKGCTSWPVSSGVFEASATVDSLGFVGTEISQVNTAMIIEMLESGHLPVLSPLGESTSGQLLNLSSTYLTYTLAQAMGAQKVIHVIPEGGLLDEEGTIIPSIDLSHIDEFPKHLHQELQRLRSQLEAIPGCSVAFTSPSNLVKELLTHKGAGTYIGVGETVLRFGSLRQLDVDKLVRVLESAFGQRLPADYMSSLEPTVKEIFISESYSTVGIITQQHPDDVPYLEKFCVLPRAQGQGQSEALWSLIKQHHPKLYWRSRSNNTKINNWYTSRANGTYRPESSNWMVFWYGVGIEVMVDSLIDSALTRPVTFHGTSQCTRQCNYD